MKKPWIKSQKMGLLWMISLLILSCQHENKETIEENLSFCLNETLKAQLELETLKLQPISKQIELSGEVSFDQEKVFHFHSLIDAIAEKVTFSLGDYVEKGQLMAEIKSPELNALVLEKKNLALKIKLAQREVSSQENLYNNHLITELEWMTSKSELSTLELELENLQQTLSMFHAQPSRGTFEIRSPISGYIIQKNMKTGSHIMESDELFTISDLREVWVMANIYATDLAFIQENMEVHVKTLAYPDQVFTGKIHSIAKIFDEEEKVLKARIQIQNSDYRLKPGMVASVMVEIPSDEQALAIAKDEVIFSDNQYYVVVYHDDCDLSIKRLKIIGQNHDDYFVNGGLSAGDRIVTSHQLLIYEKIK